MVRQGNTHQGVYERRRTYAMKTILEKTCEAIGKCINFKFKIKQKHWLNRSRWKLAVELLTNGYYYYRNSEAIIIVKRIKDTWKTWFEYVKEKKKDEDEDSIIIGPLARRRRERRKRKIVIMIIILLIIVIAMIIMIMIVIKMTTIPI